MNKVVSIIISAVVILFCAQPACGQKKEISQAKSYIKSGSDLDKAESLMTGLLKDSANRSNIKIYALWYEAVKGQYEAAQTLGMTPAQTMRRIILPQVIRIVLPPISNETINLVKDTSLIYILAMNDLLRVARTIVQREFDMTPFVIAAVFYLAMTFVLTWGFKKLEAYYGKYEAEG